jgi:hypothetical protein
MKVADDFFKSHSGGVESILGPLGTSTTEWPIVPAPGDCDDDREFGGMKYSEKTCPSATLSTTNPTWSNPGSNLGRSGGKPETNRLSYSAASGRWYYSCVFKSIKLSADFQIHIR